MKPLLCKSNALVTFRALSYKRLLLFFSQSAYPVTMEQGTEPTQKNLCTSFHFHMFSIVIVTWLCLYSKKFSHCSLKHTYMWKEKIETSNTCICLPLSTLNCNEPLQWFWKHASRLLPSQPCKKQICKQQWYEYKYTVFKKLLFKAETLICYHQLHKPNTCTECMHTAQ